MFLSTDEIERLTGFKHKAKQCVQLDKMYIPYRLNARNEPIVAESWIDGGKVTKESKAWQPALLKFSQ